jgi:CO dehydrogenase maturation factor
MSHFFLERDSDVLLDMEAGVEHLGRATAQGVENMIVVIEPGQRSLDTARHIRSLAEDIGIRRVSLVGNKFTSDSQRKEIARRVEDFPMLGFISYNEKLVEADIAGRAVFEDNPLLMDEVRAIRRSLSGPT